MTLTFFLFTRTIYHFNYHLKFQLKIYLKSQYNCRKYYIKTYNYFFFISFLHIYIFLSASETNCSASHKSFEKALPTATTHGGSSFSYFLIISLNLSSISFILFSEHLDIIKTNSSPPILYPLDSSTSSDSYFIELAKQQIKRSPASCLYVSLTYLRLFKSKYNTPRFSTLYFPDAIS